MLGVLFEGLGTVLVGGLVSREGLGAAAGGVDSVLGDYAVCVGLVLGLAGLVLVILGRGLGRDVSGVWRTYRGWLVMAPLVLGVVWLGREATIVGVGVLSVMGFREFARATGLGFVEARGLESSGTAGSEPVGTAGLEPVGATGPESCAGDWRDRVCAWVVHLAISGLVALALVRDPRTGEDGWYGLFMALPVYVIALLLVIPVLRNRAEGQLRVVTLGIVGFVYLGWMFGHLAFLVNSEHFYGYVLFLVFAVELNDVAAFVFGKAFGGRKLRDRVSPGKTVAGSLGALGVSMVLPWVLWFSFPHFGVVELVLTGLIVGIGGQLGDLTISWIKRDLGVKDMGDLIPGHGGILDRVDSLIFTAPLFFHMVRWFDGV